MLTGTCTATPPSARGVGLYLNGPPCHAIYAAAIARDDVLRPFDRHAGAEHALEEVALGGAEALADIGGGADGAVVFYKEEGVAVAADLRHIAFLAADAREVAKFFLEWRRVRDAGPIRRALRGRARVEHFLHA